MPRPYTEVPLQGKRGGTLLIDNDDLHIIAGRRISIHDPKRGYIRVHYNGKRQYLHRILMAEHIRPGVNVDHINGNTLDNRRANLRTATPTQNLQNACKKAHARTSRYIGVYFDSRPRPKPWKAQMRINGKVTPLGSYATEEEAARARDEAARIHHGEYARLNFPD